MRRTIRSALLAVIAAGCLACATMLAACGESAPQATFTPVGIQNSGNQNGAVFAMDLEVYSNNLNCSGQQFDPAPRQITSLDEWVPIQQDTDSAGQAERFYVVQYGEGQPAPQFGTMVYDSSGYIREVRLSWDSANALGDAATFRAYAVTQIMAVTGLDVDTAGRMFDTAKAAAYTNGASTQLTYACSKQVRCYYLINAGYHIVVAEPFSEQSRATEQASGKFVYTEVGAAGTTGDAGTTGTATPAQAGGTDATAGTSGTTGTSATSGQTGQPATPAAPDATATNTGNVPVTTDGN